MISDFSRVFDPEPTPDRGRKNLSGKHGKNVSTGN